MKSCSKCGREKKIGEYYTRKNKKKGVIKQVARQECKECLLKVQKENWRKKHPNPKKVYREFRNKVGQRVKVCSKCGVEKNFDAFGKEPFCYAGRRPDCKDCRNAYLKIYCNTHKKKKKAYDKEYVKINIERCIKKRKIYYEKNKERLAKKSKQWRQSERGKFLKNKAERKRKSLIKNLKNDLTFKQWQDILRLQNNKCNMCNKKFTKKLKATQDHIIPVSKCGPTTKNNIQALCHSCNSKKRTKSMEEVMRIKEKR